MVYSEFSRFVRDTGLSRTTGVPCAIWFKKKNNRSKQCKVVAQCYLEDLGAVEGHTIHALPPDFYKFYKAYWAFRLSTQQVAYVLA